MIEGIILKALSGFYYAETESGTVECRARGHFRNEKITPLVGDRVRLSLTDAGKGILEEILPRKNRFLRPAVANLDRMVIFASAAIPVTDPFLIDRIIALCETNSCEPVICINKCDLDKGDYLYEIYSHIGYRVIRMSVLTGEGITELKDALCGHKSAFTGNSGVGKSSVLNAIEPRFNLKTAEVSEKLGRGRHTTRHVELYKLSCGALVADTPGFSSFDTDTPELLLKENLQYAFREFFPYLGECRYNDCAHLKERGCAIIKALADGKINPSRHASYARLYDIAKNTNEWEIDGSRQ